MSAKFMETCKGFRTEFKPVAVKQPQANGMVERVNRTLIHVATVMCNGEGDKWAQHVQSIEYAMNTRVSSVTLYSPYELVYGRKPSEPSYVYAINREEREDKAEDEKVKELKERILVLQQLAHENQMEAAKKQQSYHDMHAKTHTFNINDYVWLYRESSLEKGITSKLKYSWKGPYKVTKVLSPVTYALTDMEGKPLPGTYHSRQLYKPLAEASPHSEGRQV